MPTTQHTPGPWRLRTSGNIGNAIEGYSGRHLDDLDNGWRAVATYQSCCSSLLMAEQDANAEANGRLMAEAPNLLAALEAAAFALRIAVDGQRGVGMEAEASLLDDIAAVIAAARGEATP